MASWKSSADRIALFERSVARKTMFGCPVEDTANGVMFMGLHQDNLFLRLSEADRARLISEHGAHLFDPMGGRPMREYVVLPEALLADNFGAGRMDRPWHGLCTDGAGKIQAPARVSQVAL